MKKTVKTETATTERKPKAVAPAVQQARNAAAQAKADLSRINLEHRKQVAEARVLSYETLLAKHQDRIKKAEDELVELKKAEADFQTKLAKADEGLEAITQKLGG